MQRQLSSNNSQCSLDAFEDQKEEEEDFIIYAARDADFPIKKIEEYIPNNNEKETQAAPLSFRPPKEPQTKTDFTEFMFKQQKERNASISETERKRVTIELQAKNELIEQSELKNQGFSEDLLRVRFSRKNENNKIEGFFPEAHLSQASKITKGGKYRTRQDVQYSNNLRQYWSNKDQYTHFKKVTNLRKDQNKRQQHTVDQSHHLIRSLLCKINNIRTFDSEQSQQENLNKKILALQEKCERKKIVIPRRTAVRVKTEGDESVKNVKHISSLQIRKLISPSRDCHTLQYSRQIEYPFNLKTNEEGIKTRYEHFRASNQQKFNKNRNLSTGAISAQEESNSTRKEKEEKCNTRRHKSRADLVQQKFSKMFRRLKELKSQEKKSIALGSLHNIHNVGSREQSALKLHWSRQRNRLRNNLVKSSTEDMAKLSCAIQRKTSSALHCEQRDRSCKIISPIFVCFQKE